MHDQEQCPIPGCGRPARDYHGDGQEIICHEHYLHDLAVLRRSHTMRQVRACCERSVAKGTLHTEIAYDRQEKCYRLVATNGVELGKYRRRCQAEEARLALEAPETLELARRAACCYPELADRALRAAQLVAAGKVQLNGTVHAVQSQHNQKEYAVGRTATGAWRCTCPDWQATVAGEPFGAPIVGRGPKCKHILAVLIALRKANP